MTIGGAGFLELAVYQEVLTREAVRTTGTTWRRNGLFEAANNSRAVTNARAMLDQMLTELVADYEADRAHSPARVSGPVLDCGRWSLLHVAPTNEWDVALAIVKKPPIAKYDSVSTFTRISDWEVSTRMDPKTGLVIRGLKDDLGWRVVDVSLSYHSYPSFQDAVDEFTKQWGSSPSRCGPDVKRFEFEKQGCYWYDNWCDTWAMVIENAQIGYLQAIVSSFTLDRRHKAALKREDEGRQKTPPK